MHYTPQIRALLKEVAIFPRALHPAVWQRRTGEKVLHVGPWMAVGVEHHEDAAAGAAKALLRNPAMLRTR